MRLRLPHWLALPTDQRKNDTMKAYEAIAQSLIAEGVTDFFGLMGDGNMWLWCALCRNPSVKPYNARHESMAVSMADGYTRTTGKIGVAMVTCGPGLTQCGTSLIAAYRGKTPLVLIAGEIEAGAKNSTQTMDQRRFAEASSARFFTITNLDNMAEEIAEAFYAARTARGVTRAATIGGRKPMKVYEAIAQSLVAEGVTDFFGLMGDGNM